MALIHHDVRSHRLARIITHALHLNPANQYPRIFVDAASHVSDTRLWFLASLAMVYSGARSVEAYGLWFERRWAEWFALVSGAIYLPVEIYELRRHVTEIKIAALVVNVVIVAFIGWRLRLAYKERLPQPDHAVAKPEASLQAGEEVGQQKPDTLDPQHAGLTPSSGRL